MHTALFCTEGKYAPVKLSSVLSISFAFLVLLRSSYCHTDIVAVTFTNCQVPKDFDDMFPIPLSFTSARHLFLLSFLAMLEEQDSRSTHSINTRQNCVLDIFASLYPLKLLWRSTFQVTVLSWTFKKNYA